MRKINIQLSTDFIYAGQLNENVPKNVTLNIEGNLVVFDLLKIVNDIETTRNLSVRNIQEICRTCNIKTTIYPNGGIKFSKLESSKDELKTCYVSRINEEYLIVIALDETQPMIYKSELLCVFKVS
jgi:plasmid maintenance system killer protein